MSGLTDTRLAVDIRALIRDRRRARTRSVVYRWETSLGEQAPATSVFSFAGPGIIRVTHQGGTLPDEILDVTFSSCHFGNLRSWFQCSTVGCARRAAILYGTPRGFRCRHCAQLTYRSQREQPYDRMLRRGRRLRGKAGGSASLMEPFPARPKGMWWKTYDRLLKQDFEVWSGIAENRQRRRGAYTESAPA